jgi:hypothetical protein
VITTIVGFAISMAFLFLMLSAACSAIQEIVANLMRWRAKTLEEGLTGLLRNKDFREAVYQQPLIQGLYAPTKFRKALQSPTYIPPQTLALAILAAAKEKGLALNGATASATFADTEKMLVSLLKDCGSVEEQRKRLEGWFNDSMDRVSGWYKRKAHAWIWIFGIALSLMLNADAITLSKRFWTDQALREAVAAEATEYVKSHPKGPDTDSGVASDDKKPLVATASEAAELDASLRRLNLLRENMPGVPLGWCFLHKENPFVSDKAESLKAASESPKAKSSDTVIAVGDQKGWCWPDLIHPSTGPVEVALAATDPRIVKINDPSAWFWKIIGLLATTLAISQGAPFWFDLLQKAVNLRLAGSPPQTPATKK